jgi:GH43 family beta-xylosidase
MRKSIKNVFNCLLIVVLTSIGVSSCNGGNKNSSISTETKGGGISINETFYNPLVIDQGMGDPWIVYHDGFYYYTQSEGTRVRVTKSKYLTQLTSNPYDETITKILFRQKSINVVEIWAPEIFFFDGYWYIYFTATVDASSVDEKDANRRTYGMKSKTSEAFGEWEIPVKIELPCDYRSIDATFMNYGGNQYIIWSGWPYSTNNGYHQNLYITELENGNPLKAKSTEVTARHLISEPYYDYETSSVLQNEGPSVAMSPNGKPVIFYSGNFSGDVYIDSISIS